MGYLGGETEAMGAGVNAHVVVDKHLLNTQLCCKLGSQLEASQG